MGLFKKKGPTIGEGDENPAEQEVEEVKSDKKGTNFGGGVDVALAKIQGKLDSLSEMRKATSERFSLVTEQMGELRGMLTKLNQEFSKVEVESSKAIDKVNSVQPETFMTELRKNQGKLDALKANIESNESLMKDLMSEIKEMRHKMDLYKGTEQILKMHEEVKQELANIKKVESTVERHANRVETMFLDVEKKFNEFDKFNNTVKDLSRSFGKIQGDFDKIRVKVDLKADKKEFVDLVNKFNDFEKHTGNIIKLLDERSKHMKDDMKIGFNNMSKQLSKKYDVKVNFKESMVESSSKKSKGFLGIFKKKSGNEDEKYAEDKDNGSENEEQADSKESSEESSTDRSSNIDEKDKTPETLAQEKSKEEKIVPKKENKESA